MIDNLTARLIAALRSTPHFSVTIAPSGQPVICKGDTSRRMVTAGTDGLVSSHAIYEGRLTDAMYLPYVSPLLFNKFFITENGIGCDFNDSRHKLIQLDLQRGKLYSSLEILRMLNAESNDERDEIANVIYQYRKCITLSGTSINEGSIRFNDVTHTAVHELIGDERTEETILEEIERVGRLNNLDVYKSFVDTFVARQYEMSEEHNRHVTRAMNAIMFINASGLTVVDDSVVLYGKTYPANLLLTA